MDTHPSTRGRGMRIVAVTQNITVDGSIEFLGDWFDPTADQTGITAHLNAVQK